MHTENGINEIKDVQFFFSLQKTALTVNNHLPLRSIVCDTLAFLLFIWLLDNDLFQRGHGQPFYTSKWPLTVKAVWTDG